MSPARRAFVSVTGLGKQFGDVQAVKDVHFTIAEGELLTLLGPSGCGKTTILRCIAGLEEPDAGEIRIGDHVVTAPEVFVAPEHRNVGMVFQSYAVWPHMTVYQNVAFPLRVRRGSTEVDRRVRDALALVGLASMEDRNATMLSGGQQQRVALARALVHEPRLLLFDEPLSNLDAKLRERMRGEILALQKRLGITTLYVTHDQEEAMAISDRLIVLNAGRVVQTGTPRELYQSPTNAFVMDFIGTVSLIPAKVLTHLDNQLVAITDGTNRYTARHSGPIQIGQLVWASVRPERIAVAKTYLDGPNVFIGRVAHLAYLGDRVECRIAIPGGEFRVRVAPDFEGAVGSPVYLRIDPADIYLLPRDPEVRHVT